MRIVLIGQAAFAEKVLERLIKNGENVVGLYCPPDPPGDQRNRLTELARSVAIAVFQPERMRHPAVLEEYKALQPDLNIMAFVTEIIPFDILSYPTHGSIQYHPSLLPKHRGRSAINWAIIKGEKRTGLSIFWVDEGIDTGPILLQKEVEIGPDDTTGSLYFNKLFPMGVDALMEALAMIKAGAAPRIAQDASQATYEPPCDSQHARIDWSRPFGEVYDLIRGCDPQPGAYTLLNGVKVQVYDTEAFAGDERAQGHQPGEVIELAKDGILIAGKGGAFLVRRLRPAGKGKMPAVAYADEAGLHKGSRCQPESI